MTHDHNTRNTEQSEQRQCTPGWTDSESCSGSSPAYTNPVDQSIWQHRPENISADQPVLPGLPADLVKLTYSGPTPHSSEIQRLNDIHPGLGTRIMDDAHEDIKSDRAITEQSFAYAIFEAKVRLCTAVLICVAVVALIPVLLLLLDPPESLAGVGALGLVALTPLVNTLINKQSEKKEKIQP
ncbi:hypothetical protein [Corynebacterium kutscheri]|uniref:Predicted membrane protein n=1 Tax=Corynebacterium kutscheri TaxID=35755 RepID=A0AB38VQK3_9CORY|nr:hypothetical protein [Corynebacterium kutscheri]VEH05807.1 Predicted membrane protein [Corynebacterium kutscheri]